MKQLEIKVVQMLLLICFLFKTATSRAEIYTNNIIPKPVKIEYQTGNFLINSSHKIVTKSSSNSQIQTIANYLKERSGFPISESGFGIILEIIQGIEFVSDEAYILEVNPKGISIRARNPAGLFYGVQSLLQLMPLHIDLGKGISIPCQKITDYPRFGWRGLMLDVSRHFFDFEYIKRTLDIMATLKMNVFHFHLTDDQGWRIEIKKYPLLTQKGGFRDDDRGKPWSYFQYGVTNTKPIYGGFYTQEQIKQLVKYAAERNINIVPEIDLPGHSWSAIYAYNNLSCSGSMWKKPENVPFQFSEPLCVCSPEVMNFVKDVIGEVIELFPSKYIHIGGDECRHEAWENYEICKTLMEKEKLKNTAELQGWFNRQLEQFVRSKGRYIIGWDEILEGDIAPEAAVMSWRGEEGGKEAALHQHYAVMSPSSHCYLDMNQYLGEREEGWIKILPLEKVYSYEPIPAGLDKSLEKYILGVQGNLWTENVQKPLQADIQFFPRGIALAEVGWSTKESRNLIDFKNRLNVFYKFLEKNKYAYAIPIPVLPLMEYTLINSLTVNPVFDSGNGANAFYTLNGEEPTVKSAKVNGAIVITSSVKLKMKAFRPSGVPSKTFEATFTKMDPISNSIFITPKVKGLINYTYLEGSIKTLKDWKNLRKKSFGDISSITIPGFARADSFALEYNGNIEIKETGVYTFYLASDDGSSLEINDVEIINHDGTHGATEKYKQIALAKGIHSFKLQYFEALYSQSLSLSMDGPNMPKQLIPSSILSK